TARVGSFGFWISQAAASGGLSVFTVADIASRAVFTTADLPDLAEEFSGPVLEADGLDWLIRIGLLWQQVAVSPLRRAQGGGLVKGEGERLEQDPLLNSRPAVGVLDLPDVGFLTAEIAERAGILTEVEGEIRAAALPAWEGGLWEAIEGLFPCLFQV